MPPGPAAPLIANKVAAAKARRILQKADAKTTPRPAPPKRQGETWRGPRSRPAASSSASTSARPPTTSSPSKGTTRSRSSAGRSRGRRQVKRLAKRVIDLNAEEEALSSQIGELAAAVPEVGILRTIPGVGRVCGAVIAAEIGDVFRFKDSAHLATYAGLSPVRRQSSASVNKKRKRKGGNRRLKNAFMQSADSARHHEPWAREYYDRKRREGRKRKQALLALARRRVDVVYAMLSHLLRAEDEGGLARHAGYFAEAASIIRAAGASMP